MLLFLVKHSHFDIANSVRELSKLADGVTTDHWKKLLHNIKFVVSSEYLALKMKPDTDESFLIWMELLTVNLEQMKKQE
jgi:hypothetical protein